LEHLPQPDITIYSHSAILYWWPVWVVGFLVALLTYLDGGRMAYVPAGVRVEGNTLIAPDGRLLEEPHNRMAQNPYLGTLFFLTVLLVFVSSNVQLRGLWEWIAVLAVGTVVLAVLHLGLWTPLMSCLQLLHIHINLAGYVFLSVGLFAIWVVTVFIVDRRTHVIVSVGQVRIRDAIGQAEKVYDATGMTFHVQPNILIRHRVLGLYGAGDLVIRGPHGDVLEWPNVMFARSRLKQIQKLLKERLVVS
jgi:hypothetical protein